MSWLLWWRQPPHLADVIINMKHDPDTVFRGLLWQARGPFVVLRKATMIGPHGTTAIGGAVFVPRDNIAFLQTAPPSTS